MDFKHYKKTSDDGNVVTMSHPRGHKVQIVKSQLSPPLLKQLNSLPLHQSDPQEAVADPTQASSDTSSPAKGINININTAPQPTQAAPPQPDAPKGGALGSMLKQAGSNLAPEGQPALPGNMFHPQQPPAPQASPAGSPPAQPQDPFASVPGYSEQKAGIDAQSQALQTQGNQDEKTLNASVTAEQKNQEALHTDLAEKTKEIQGVITDIGDGHIKPDHYMESGGALRKVSTAIGLILGGISSGKTGQPNPALTFLNAQIDRDLKAQQATMENKHNLLSALNKQYGDRVVAENMFRAIRLATVSDQIKSAAAKSQSAQAKAAAQMATGTLKQQFIPLVQQAAWLSLARGEQGQPTPSAPGMPATAGGASAPKEGGSQLDPATLVPHLVPPERQKEVFEEIKNSQHVTKNYQGILDAFDQAAKENTVMRTGAGLLRTPGSVNMLHQLTLPLFESIDGTVRQAAMDESNKNLTPQPGDSAHKIEQRRAALVGWLKSHEAAPTAKGYQIDLSKFRATNPDLSYKAPTETKTVGGVPYQKVKGGWKRVQ